jgi:hypothetical protein
MSPSPPRCTVDQTDSVTTGSRQQLLPCIEAGIKVSTLVLTTPQGGTDEMTGRFDYFDYVDAGQSFEKDSQHPRADSRSMAMAGRRPRFPSVGRHHLGRPNASRGVSTDVLTSPQGGSVGMAGVCFDYFDCCKSEAGRRTFSTHVLTRAQGQGRTALETVGRHHVGSPPLKRSQHPGADCPGERHRWNDELWFDRFCCRGVAETRTRIVQTNAWTR